MRSSHFRDTMLRRLVVTKYKYTLRNIPEQRNSHLHRGGNLKSSF
jgi:hypothetical protein